jgi:cell division protein FtsZ
MREGPLAALFRRTDEDEAAEGAPAPEGGVARAPEGVVARAPEAPVAPPAPAPAAPVAHEAPHPSLAQPAPPLVEEPVALPTPQDRLRGAFSSDLPENVLARPAAPAPAPAPVVDPFARPEPTGSVSAYAAVGTAPVRVGHPVIKVIGVGGAGVNAVNRMVEAEVQGVEFLAINTDVQSLQGSTADITLHIGPGITRGSGAGSNPTWGARARWRSTTRSRRCSRAPTWSSSPRAPAAGRARAPRPSWPASPRSSGR